MYEMSVENQSTTLKINLTDRLNLNRFLTTNFSDPTVKILISLQLSRTDVCLFHVHSQDAIYGNSNNHIRASNYS